MQVGANVFLQDLLDVIQFFMRDLEEEVREETEAHLDGL